MALSSVTKINHNYQKICYTLRFFKKKIITFSESILLKVENIHSSEHASNGVYRPCMAHTNILYCPINTEIRAVDQIWQCCDSPD